MIAGGVVAEATAPATSPEHQTVSPLAMISWMLVPVSWNAPAG
jgi:hypothetical protein